MSKKEIKKESKEQRKIAKEERKRKRILRKKLKEEKIKNSEPRETTSKSKKIKPIKAEETVRSKNLKILDRMILNNQLFTFYYYDMNRNNRSDVGISPGGETEILKRSGRYEGKHHIHVEVNNKTENCDDWFFIQGQYTEDSNINSLNSNELYPVILSTYQSLYERTIYDTNIYIRHNRPIDQQHVNAAVNQINKIKKYCDVMPAEDRGKLYGGTNKILNFYNNYLSKSHQSAELSAHKQELIDLNIFNIRTANFLSI